MGRAIEIVDYDPQWAALFEEEKNRILDVIEHIIAEVEHIGSTAVVGLGAKLIIDIMVAVTHLSDAERCIEPPRSIGYEYAPEHEVSIPERRYFHKGHPPEEQHYHLHMVERTSDFWKKHLLFRNYLRGHPQAVQEYCKLKKLLAIKYCTDREAYTTAKTSFIESIVTKARAKRKVVKRMQHGELHKH